MKTLKNYSLKVIMSLMMIAVLFPSCSQGNKTGEKSSLNQSEIDIHGAVISDNENAVRDYIESGGDINLKDNFSGSTPLNTAAVFGKTGIAKMLIDAGADLSIKNNDGSTPLHTAAFFGRIEIVQMLIDAHADKTIKNKYGATPRETVTPPFAEVKSIYDMMQQQLGPLGLKLDMTQLEKNRPVIAMMLQ